jgi:hypothetical protein
VLAELSDMKTDPKDIYNKKYCGKERRVKNSPVNWQLAK